MLNKNAWALFLIIFSHYPSAKPHSSHDQQSHQFSHFSCPLLSVQPLDALRKYWYLPRKAWSPFSAPLTSFSFELQWSNELPASSPLQIFLIVWQTTIAWVWGWIKTSPSASVLWWCWIFSAWKVDWGSVCIKDTLRSHLKMWPAATASSHLEHYSTDLVQNQQGELKLLH